MKPRRWYTDTPRIPLASDMRLLRRKPLKHIKHVPVLVTPLAPEAIAKLRAKVRQAINWWWDGESDFQTCLENSTDEAMHALGFPWPRKK